MSSAVEPAELTTGVGVVSSGERTSQVRTSKRLTSTVDVTIENTGDRLIEPPLHAVITFLPDQGGELNGLTASGLLGGIGKTPYQTFYKDLSDSIGTGLPVGGKVRFTFGFSRPPTLGLRYEVAIRGLRNRDPIAAIGGPYSGQQGVTLRFDASASSDPDGDALSFSWDFGDGNTGTGPTPEHGFEASGLYNVRLTVADGRGALVARETQVPVVPPGVFALARTRTLDGNGHPLGEVTIEQASPAGAQTLRSDAVSGFASLGGAPGEHTWTFTRGGYLTSYRKATLGQGLVKVVAFPWLSVLSTQRTPLSLLNPTVVRSANERVVLTLPPEAFEQVESVAITELGGQTLPLPLPAGWSPLAVFHVDLPMEAASDIAATVNLLESVAPSQSLVLVHLDTSVVAWIAESLHSGAGNDIARTSLRKPGTYAVVLADILPSGNPSAAVAGEALPAGASPVIAPEVAATGTVDPSATIASLDPALVTAEATVDFTNSGQALASGAWFLAEVTETYEINDGQAFKTPDYDATFYAYQHPGDPEPDTARAVFPLRPSILFGPDQLTEAHIKVDVLALNQFSGGVITPDGGQLSLNGLRIGVPAGAVSVASAAEIRPIATTQLTRFLGGLEPLLAFELNLPLLTGGAALEFLVTRTLSPDAHFVLARLVSSGSETGLQPVLRLLSDAQGTVTGAEPATGPKLPGVNGSGQYVLVQLAEPQDLVYGTVRLATDNSPAPGASVRVTGQPWLAITPATGSYQLLAPIGPFTLTALRNFEGFTGRATGTMPDPLAAQSVDIPLGAAAPFILTTSPAADATRVPVVTPVTITFSERMAAGPFAVPGAIRVVDPEDADIPATLTLDLSGRTATLLPLNPLTAATGYRIIAATTLLDLHGQSLTGPNIFPFTTAPPAARGEGAQLVIYEPGAANVPPEIVARLVGYREGSGSTQVVATGGPGTADPEVPVVLVNLSSGETATVLSKADGSFATFLDAAEEDFLEAVFVNANATRITVPASRQQFDDGRVGLYQGGGILEASNEEAGNVEVFVKPGSIPSRTVFRVEVLTQAESLEKLDGLTPQNGIGLVGGLTIETEGDQSVEFQLRRDIPFELLGITSAAELEGLQLALASPYEYEGVRVFSTIAMPSAPAEVRATLPAAPSPGRKAPRNGINAGIASFVYNITGGALPGSFTTGLRLSGAALNVSGSVSATSGRGLVPGPDGKLRVPGAFVFPGPVDSTGAPLRDADGLPVISSLSTGMVGAVSHSVNGGFVLAVDRPVPRAEPFIFAVSSRFPRNIARGAMGVVGDDATLSQIARTAFPLFRDIDLAITADNIAPVIAHSFSPARPAALGDLAPFKLILIASDAGNDVAPQMTLSLLSFRPVDPLQSGSPAENIRFTKVDEVQVGSRLQQVWQIAAQAAGRVEFEAAATDANGNQELKRLFADIDRNVLLDLATGKGPLVVGTIPANGSTGVLRSEPVVIQFSEPMDPDSLGFLDTMFSVPVVSSFLRDQGRELVVYLDSSSQTQSVSAHISALLRNTAGGNLDQDPTTEPNESYSFSFDYSVNGKKVSFPVNQAGGVAGHGRFQFVLERQDKQAVGGGALLVFQTPEGETLKQIGNADLPPFPRDILYLGRYSYHHPIGGVITSDLLAVTGGLGGLGQDSWLRIYDVSDPAIPFLVAGSDIGLGGTALPVKLAWSPPRLGILFLDPDATSVMELDLQLFIRCQNLADYSTEPPGGDPGLDLNGDGDYTDAGEQIPRPQGAAPKVGVINAGAVETSQLTAVSAKKWRFTDFDMSSGGRLMVACGRSLSPGSDHRLWVLKAPGRFLNDNEDAFADFPLTSEPSRIKLLANQRLVLSEERIEVKDLVLVSLDDGRVRIFDVSDPAAIVPFNDIVIPAADGKPRSFMTGGDGLLYLLCTNNMLVFNPELLGSASVDFNGTAAFRKAYVHRIPGIGAGTRAFSVTDVNHVATAFNSSAAFVGDSLPAVDFEVISAELTHLSEKEPALINGLLGLNSTKVIRRKSSDGILELVDKATGASGLGTFKPVLIGSARHEPANLAVPRAFPEWRFKENGQTATTLIGNGFLERQITGVPAYSRAKTAAIQILPPLVDFAALALAGSSAGYEVHQVIVDGKELEIRVLPGIKLDDKLDMDEFSAIKLGPFNEAFKALGERLPGKPVLKLEGKGALGYKAAWVDNPSSHEALLALSAAFGLDPLIGIKVELGIPPPVPPPASFVVIPLLDAAGIKFFVAVGGSVSLVGTVARSESGEVSGSADIGGKIALSAGAKMKANGLVKELSLAGETGLAVKGTVVPGTIPSVTLKKPRVDFEGLSVKFSLKLNTGGFSISKKATVIEPATLLQGDDITILD